ncbi:MAG: hypothetical protein GY928_26250, partial [Colwellia sp.]|nr:hypothetical protein [Colwellia sp.]
ITEGDTLTVVGGNGIATSAGATDDVTAALSALTADWNQTGASDIFLNNSSSDLRILDSDGTHSGYLDVGDLTGDVTLTIEDGSSGNICTDNGNCLGGAGGGANTALSNLTSVAINTTLLPGVAGTPDLGSGTLPFGELFIAGTSGTPGTNNFRFTGASTSGTRILTIPDAGGTLAVSASGPITLSAAGDLGCATCLVDGDIGGTVQGYDANTTILGSDIDLASAEVTGTLTANKGGTGIASYTIGDLIYASGATTLSALADVASGSCLLSQGVGVAPAYGACPGDGVGISSLTFAGDSGTPQTITEGDTLTVVGGNGIATSAGATDDVTAALSALTADWNQTGASDIFL